MALTITHLFDPNQIDNVAAETIYTVPASPTTSFLQAFRVRFTNTTAGPITIDAWAVPSGGSEADSNAFLKTYSIAANDYLDIDVPTLEAGDFFSAQASAATSITCTSLGGTLVS